jgi:hypothetical protein
MFIFILTTFTVIHVILTTKKHSTHTDTTFLHHSRSMIARGAPLRSSIPRMLKLYTGKLGLTAIKTSLEAPAPTHSPFAPATATDSHIKRFDTFGSSNQENTNMLASPDASTATLDEPATTTDSHTKHSDTFGFSNHQNTNVLERPADIKITSLDSPSRLYTPASQTMLDAPAPLPMLDVPAPPMLDVPAPLTLDDPAHQSSTLDFPAHLAHPICGNSPPHWTLGCITPGPSNPHDPGPSATVDLEKLNLMLYVPAQTILSVLVDPLNTIRSTSLLLWTPELMAPGPSNPHDPRPSATVADHTLTSFFHHLIFSVIAFYALIDFLCIPPRSPSPAPVFIWSVCL